MKRLRIPVVLLGAKVSIHLEDMLIITAGKIGLVKEIQVPEVVVVLHPEAAVDFLDLEVTGVGLLRDILQSQDS